jgi:SAM-dependent methyltransferase
MNASSLDDKWTIRDAYEAFMGRWSRLVAEQFIRWLDSEPGLTWLDVGCGTGALVSAISNLADPFSIIACDPSKSFVDHARRRIQDPRVSMVLAGADSLPENPGGFHRVVSGLVLNFLPEPRQAVGEMRERVRPGGIVAAYVWDYAGRMEHLRIFWDEAVAMDPSARDLDEGVRFSMCRRDALESMFRGAGMRDVRSDAVEIRMRFETFSDYWKPFLRGTGPAPAYVASLSGERRAELRGRLESRLAARSEGAIALAARAWAVQGAAP